jgi:hypothetical protein
MKGTRLTTTVPRADSPPSGLSPARQGA